MSKGTVKARIKQLANGGAVTTNNYNHHGNGSKDVSPSPSYSSSSSDDDPQQNQLSPGIAPNTVQSMIKAAEQNNDQQHNNNHPTTSPLFNKKRPSLPNSNSNNFLLPKSNGTGSRKCSSPDTRIFSEKPPPKPNFLGKLSPRTSPSNIRKTPLVGRANSNTKTSPSSPPLTPSRKASLPNSSKPSIPQKPTSLSNLSPRKPSLTQNSPVSPQPQPKPQIPQKSPTHTNSNKNDNNDNSCPIYAQVNKPKAKNTENSSSSSRSNSPKHDRSKNNTCNSSQSKNDNSQDITIRGGASAGSNVVLRSGEGGRARRDSEQYRDSVFNTIYDNAAALSAAELFDSSWSDSDSYKDFSDDENDDDNDNGDGSKKDKKRKKHEDDKDATESVKGDVGSHEDKRFRIAGELLKTEQDYVAMLHLLHVVFYTRLSEENSQHQFFPPDVLKRIFSNLKSIYLFHNDFLLPQLESRMKNWDKDSRIGDLMKKNAPFLKLYSEYINNFSHAMKLLKEWLEKSTRFLAIIQEIQKDPACGNLSLQHHMLGPIQRVPRYELLLKDYVKHLPADSPDMTDAKDALDLVTKAACHSNEAIEKIETFRKLLDIYQNLRGVAVDFISPTREFVMQGPVTKISARSGEKQPRYIFLFNDLVLICSQLLLGAYNVRSELQVDSMEIKPGNNMNIPHTFMVHSKQKAVELLDETSTPDRLDWEKKMKEVIESHRIKKRSIKQDEVDYPYENMVPDSCLGKTAPVWIPDDAATQCMLCTSSFSMMRRRHHCRSCGKLVCKSCCNRAPLEYKQGKIERVCSHCYDVIVNKVCDSSPDSPVKSFPNGNSPKKTGSVKVKASDPALIASYLQCSEDNGKSWHRLWVAAHSDYVLYTFKAHEDVTTVSILPLPGHKVEKHSQHKAFCIRHKNKKRSLLYQPDSSKKVARWVAVLEKLVKAELPDETVRHSTQSSGSNNSSSSDTVTTTTTTAATMHADDDDDDDGGGSGIGINGQLDCEDPNDEKADARSQYDNVDP